MFKFVIKLIKKYHQLVRFLISGGLATLVDFFFVWLFFDHLKMRIMLAAALAFLFAFFASFYLQKYWTFRDRSRSKTRKQMFMFLILGLCGLAVNSFGMHILVEIFHIWYMLALAIVIGGLAMVNYFVYKFIIFKKEHQGLKRKVLLSEGGEEKIRLLIATGIYPPDIGGPATYTKVLKRGLSEFGFRVKVVTYADNSDIKENDVYKIRRSQNILFRYCDYFYSIWKLSVWSDIIYAHDLVSVGIPCSLVKMFKPEIKLVVRLGGDFLWEKAFNNEWTSEPLINYYKRPKKIREKIFIKIYKFVLAKCDKIIFSTEWQKEIYEKYLQIDKTKACVVENIYPKVHFPEHEEFKFNQKKNILFVGRLIKLKNIELLLQAVKEVKGVRLLIIGRGPDKKRLFELIRKMELTTRVKVRDRMPHQEILHEILKSFLFVIPSITEISSNLFLECLKLQKPVILSQEGGFYKKYKDDIMFINPFDKADLVNKINFLLNENNYNAYLDKIKKIDTSRGKKELLGDHSNILKNL